MEPPDHKGSSALSLILIDVGLQEPFPQGHENYFAAIRALLAIEIPGDDQQAPAFEVCRSFQEGSQLPGRQVLPIAGIGDLDELADGTAFLDDKIHLVLLVVLPVEDPGIPFRGASSAQLHGHEVFHHPACVCGETGRYGADYSVVDAIDLPRRKVALPQFEREPFHLQNQISLPQIGYPSGCGMLAFQAEGVGQPFNGDLRRGVLDEVAGKGMNVIVPADVIALHDIPRDDIAEDPGQYSLADRPCLRKTPGFKVCLEQGHHSSPFARRGVGVDGHFRAGKYLME